MVDTKGKSSMHKALGKIMIWGALATCITASPMQAQDIIGGNFTLNENARLGSSVLGPGQYRFSIEPVGTIQSIHSIQQGAGHLVLLVVRPEKPGPAASIFAMASPSSHQGETNELILEPEKAGALAQTLNLEKEGLTVDLRWWSPKTKSHVVAQERVPVEIAAAARSAGK